MRESKPLNITGKFLRTRAPAAISPELTGQLGTMASGDWDPIANLVNLRWGRRLALEEGGQISPSQPSDTHGTKNIFLPPSFSFRLSLSPPLTSFFFFVFSSLVVPNHLHSFPFSDYASFFFNFIPFRR
jgi:hypothetical protein